jgi:hypothetical protein
VHHRTCSHTICHLHKHIGAWQANRRCSSQAPCWAQCTHQYLQVPGRERGGQGGQSTGGASHCPVLALDRQNVRLWWPGQGCGTVEHLMPSQSPRRRAASGVKFAARTSLLELGPPTQTSGDVLKFNSLKVEDRGAVHMSASVDDHL